MTSVSGIDTKRKNNFLIIIDDQRDLDYCRRLASEDDMAHLVGADDKITPEFVVQRMNKLLEGIEAEDLLSYKAFQKKKSLGR